MPTTVPVAPRAQAKRLTQSSKLTRRGEIRLLSGPLWERSLLLAVIFMPFQYALTINLFFPLKISEILIAISIVAYAVAHRRLKWDFASTVVLLLALAAFFSTVFNLPSRFDLSTTGYDRPLEADTLLYLGYALFALTLWALLRRVDREKSIRAVVVSIWTCGAAVLLQWIASITGSSALIAILGFRAVGIGGDTSSLRSGPFLEGQHLGFFAGAALLLAIYRRSYWSVAVAAASIVFSQSTTAYVGLAAGLVCVLILRPRSRSLSIIGAVGVIGAVVVLTVPALQTILGRQLAKLGFTEFAPDYQFATTSLDIRSAKTSISFDMMLENPIFGVGPGRFGANFGSFSPNYDLPVYYYTSATARPIAENAYGHVGAELGVAALVLFGSLVLYALLRNWRSSPAIFALAPYLAISVSTQSSWTFLPIWTFIAILCAKQSDDAQGDAPSPPSQDTATGRSLILQ